MVAWERAITRATANCLFTPSLQGAVCLADHFPDAEERPVKDKVCLGLNLSLFVSLGLSG